MRLIQKYGFVFLLFMGLIAVYIQQEFEIFKEPVLKNDIQLATKPMLSLKDLASGNFQRDYEAYLRGSFGFFNSVFMNYNQMEFSIFKRAHARGVVVGKDNFLYEIDYINAYYGRDLLSDSVLSDYVRKLVKVQAALEKNNTQIMVVLAPGKASFYPEFIPNYLKHDGLPSKNNVAAIEQALLKNDINVLNLNRWFVQLKETAKYPLLSQTGIHWTVFGMGLANDTIIKASEKMLNKSLPNIYYNSIVESIKPRSTDDDIEKGMNLMNRVNEQILAYPKYEYTSRKDTAKAILIADSYGIGLYRQGLLTESFTDGEFWFYNQTLFTTSNQNGAKVRYFNKLQKFKETDIIILLATEATLHRFFYGFVDDAFELYYPDDELVMKKNGEIEEIMNWLIKDENSLKRLQEKATAEGQILDVIVRSEAEYIYRMKNKK